MWKALKDLLQTVFTLARDMEQVRNEIKETRQDLTKLTLAVQHLDNRINLTQQEDNNEREKLAMQLQIELLKFEKQLPASPIPGKKKKMRPNASQT